MDEIEESGTIQRLQMKNFEYTAALKKNFYHDVYFNSHYSLQNCELTNDGPTLRDISVSKTELKVSLPYPVSHPRATEITEKDRCLELIERKKEYNVEVMNARQRFKKDKDTWLRKGTLRHGTATLPQYFVKLTNRDFQDPDIYIDESYDHYYAGGNLCMINDGDEQYVVHPSTIGKLCFQKIQETLTKPKIIYFNEYPIYNMESYQIAGNCISIRQKYDLMLKRIEINSDERNVEAKNLWHVKCEDIPFIDCKYKNNTMSYVDVEYDFSVVNLENARLLKYQFPKDNERGGLAQFEYLDNNGVIFMGRKQVHLFDLRSQAINSYCYENKEFNCDKLYGFCSSIVDANCIYLMSKHSILKFDVRMMKIIRKWSHLINQPPVICKVSSHQYGELLFISSFNETICLQLHERHNYLPFALPTINDTLLECNLKRRPVLRKDLRKRFQMSTAGMAPLRIDAQRTKLYTCSSIGDVFCNNLSFNDVSNDDELETFTNWINHLPPESTTLKVTDIRNLRALKKRMMKPGRKKVDKYWASNNRIKKMLKQSRKDDDNDFATIWVDPVPLETDVVEINPAKKVAAWLQTTENVDSSKMEND